MNFISKAALLTLVLASSACSVLDSDKVDYKSVASNKAPSLEVPPDLAQLQRETRYAVPGGTVSANNYQTNKAVPGVPTAATSVGDVRVERAGTQSWLVVSRNADQLWGPVRDFWQESGFLLTLDQANLGIMETDWAENRAKLPQDIIRNTVGKVFDSLYSTGERDRFRTRLERNPNGGTDIFISHRRVVEVYTNTLKDNTVWQPAPADPALEAEFLRRLMLKLGVPQEAATKAAAAPLVSQSARMATVNNVPVVQMDEGFDRAWRRVGLALDRTGFTVEDRDRNQGVYFVRYVEPNADKANPGFFAKLFSGSGNAPAPLKYRIVVRSQGESTLVSVLNAAGAPETSANAKNIVQVLVADLR